MYYIEVSGFLKIASKLQKHPLKKSIIQDIDELKCNPLKGKYLHRFNMYKLKYPNLRIYYIIIKEVFSVNASEYEGLIIIKDFGNKNHQKRFLQ